MECVQRRPLSDVTVGILGVGAIGKRCKFSDFKHVQISYTIVVVIATDAVVKRLDIYLDG